MDALLPPATQRVCGALRAAGLDCRIVRHPAGTRTAADAARAIGCEPAQIVKSLVFRGERSGDGVLVLTGGANRVDPELLEAVLGERPGKADAAFVREWTGFAIGGVPPLGHARPMRTLIDADLLVWPEVWAAAGTPDTVFALAPACLPALTGGTVLRVG